MPSSRPMASCMASILTSIITSPVVDCIRCSLGSPLAHILPAVLGLRLSLLWGLCSGSAQCISAVVAAVVFGPALVATYCGLVPTTLPLIGGAADLTDPRLCAQHSRLIVCPHRPVICGLIGTVWTAVSMPAVFGLKFPMALSTLSNHVVSSLQASEHLACPCTPKKSSPHHSHS